MCNGPHFGNGRPHHRPGPLAAPPCTSFPTYLGLHYPPRREVMRGQRVRVRSHGSSWATGSRPNQLRRTGGQDQRFLRSDRQAAADRLESTGQQGELVAARTAWFAARLVAVSIVRCASLVRFLSPQLSHHTWAICRSGRPSTSYIPALIHPNPAGHLSHPYLRTVGLPKPANGLGSTRPFSAPRMRVTRCERSWKCLSWVPLVDSGFQGLFSPWPLVLVQAEVPVSAGTLSPPGPAVLPALPTPAGNDC